MFLKDIRDTLLDVPRAVFRLVKFRKIPSTDSHVATSDFFPVPARLHHFIGLHISKDDERIQAIWLNLK